MDTGKKVTARSSNIGTWQGSSAKGCTEEICKLHRGCRLFKEVFAQAAECHCESERKEEVFLIKAPKLPYIVPS